MKFLPLAVILSVFPFSAMAVPRNASVDREALFFVYASHRNGKIYSVSEARRLVEQNNPLS